MLNRINPLKEPAGYMHGGKVEGYQDGGDVEPFFQKPEMAAPAPEGEELGMMALFDSLGEEKAAELMAAMEQFPVVQEVAEMAVHVGDGAVQGMETGATDEVAARLEPGEFIFSKPAVDVIGLENLEAMHEEAKQMAGSM